MRREGSFLRGLFVRARNGQLALESLPAQHCGQFARDADALLSAEILRREDPDEHVAIRHAAPTRDEGCGFPPAGIAARIGAARTSWTDPRSQPAAACPLSAPNARGDAPTGCGSRAASMRLGSVRTGTAGS